MRSLAIGIATLAVLLVAGLLLGPLFVDANRYKGELAEWFGAHAGIDLKLSGPIDLRLLPSPRLIARDITVAGLPALPRGRLQVRFLEANVDPWPLLSGRVEVRRATLIEPALTWERTAESPSGIQRQAVTDLAIDRIEIQNGSFTYRDGSRVELLEHVNATLRLDSLQGPYRIEGDLSTRGAAMRFEASAGRLDAPEMPLHISITSRPTARLIFDGSFSSAGLLKGKLTAGGDDLAAVAGMASEIGLPAALATRFSLSGEMSEIGGIASFDDLSLELGDVRGRGNLNVAWGAPLKLTGKIAVNHIDLDRWKGRSIAATRVASPPPPVPSEGGTSITLVPAPTPSANRPFALPQDLDAALDLSVGDVVWREKLVRDVRFDLHLTNGVLQVNRIAAGLPGGTDAMLRGSLVALEGLPRFKGRFEAGSDNLRALLNWLGISTEVVPVGRLSRGSLALKVDVQPYRVELSDLDASIDATRISGAASIAPGDRLGIGARLRADRFNLDAYLPTGSICGTVFPDVSALGLFDANLDLTVDAVTCRGQAFAGGHFAGTLRGGSLALEELSFADFADGSLRLSGSLEGLNGASPRADLAYELQGATLARIARFLLPRSGTLAEGWGGLGISGRIEGRLDALSLQGEADLLAGHGHVTAKETSGALDITADLALRQIRVKDALALGGTSSPMEARIDLDTTIRSRGQSVEELLANLSAEGRISGSEGVLTGVDLRSAAARYAATDPPPPNIGLLLRDSAGTTPVVSVAGKVMLSKSMLKTDDLRVDFAGATAKASLSLDLGTEQTQGRIDLTLDDAPTVAIAVDGPAAAPRTEISAAEREPSTGNSLRDLLKNFGR